MKIIETKNLNKIFGDESIKVHAVKDVNLTLEEGEFVAIVGASGSGKSSLLHLIGGLEEPSSGQVFIQGQDMFKMSLDQQTIFRRRHIGFIFQFFNLIPVLTVRENIELPLLLDNLEIDRNFLQDLTDQLGISHKLDFYPHSLSGGEQQRVSIARALIHQPTIILADEPTGNLDQKNSDDFLNLLKLMSKKNGITTLMITHDLNIAANADRIVRMVDGELYTK